MDADGAEPMSVRELIRELAEVEVALRRVRQPAADKPSGLAVDRDLSDLVHREQLIVHELRRRARTHRLRPALGRARPTRSD